MDRESGQEEKAVELINEDTVRQYFKFLCDDEKEIFTVCWLLSDGGDKGTVPGYGCWHGTVEDVIRVTKQLQGNYGANVSLHVTLNRTNLLGRKSGNIESARVLCLDIDDETRRLEDLTGAGALIIESSPNKWHLYWPITGITLEEWHIFQAGLAERFGGDRNLDQLSKTIRVPGVARTTKAGGVWMPVIRDTPSSIIRLDREKINEYMPWIVECAEKSVTAKKAEHKKLNKAIRAGKLDAATVSESGRNNALYSYVYAEVSRFKPGVECFTLEAATAMGEDLNSDFETPLGEREVESTVKSAFENGCVKWEERRGKYMKEISQLGTDVQVAIGEINGNGANSNGKGAHVSEVEVLEPKPTGEEFQYDFTDPFLEGNPYSDFGIMARISQRFSNLLVRCDNNVLAFNEKVKIWKVQAKGNCSELQAMYGQVVLEMRTEKRFLQKFCYEKNAFSPYKYGQALEKFESAGKLGKVLGVILMSSRIRDVSFYDFDSAQEMMYVANGALNLSNGSVRDVVAGDMFLCRSKVAWNEQAVAAKPEQFLEFLSQIHEGDSEIIDFIQEMCGYTLSGQMLSELIFCHFGDGANGKSKFLTILAEISGEYATYIDPEDIIKTNKTFRVERFGYKIKGRRLGVIDDLDVGTTWNEAFVKTATSERIRCRGEHLLSEEIVNRAKIHLGVNVLPKPEAENYGLLRRLCIIPYNVRFANDPREGARIKKIAEQEGSAILGWAVLGYQRWLRNGGFRVPEKCRAEIDDYKESNFELEGLVTEMWENAEWSEIVQPGINFEFMQDLADDFNERLSKIAPGTPEMKPESVGRVIKRVLKAKKGRGYNPALQRTVRGWFLKLKYTRQNKMNSL